MCLGSSKEPAKRKAYFATNTRILGVYDINYHNNTDYRQR